MGTTIGAYPTSFWMFKGLNSRTGWIPTMIIPQWLSVPLKLTCRRAGTAALHLQSSPPLWIAGAQLGWRGLGARVQHTPWRPCFDQRAAQSLDGPTTPGWPCIPRTPAMLQKDVHTVAWPSGSLGASAVRSHLGRPTERLSSHTSMSWLPSRSIWSTGARSEVLGWVPKLAGSFQLRSLSKFGTLVPHGLTPNVRGSNEVVINSWK